MKLVAGVAIGKSYTAVKGISSRDDVPQWVRPYILGLIDGLSSNSKVIGTDYTIDYYENPANTLTSKVFNGLGADFVVCLSRTVTDQANAYSTFQTSKQPIIGIVSDHPAYGSNVCGVSAKRSQNAHKSYENLRKSVTPKLSEAEITVLHDDRYTPSNDSKKDIENNGGHPNAQTVHSLSDVKTVIGNMSAGQGLLVNPVDWMFGEALDIISLARNAQVLDFWMAPDWLQWGAFGGYGVPQQTCGGYLAQQLNDYWGGTPPATPWKEVKTPDFVWQVSKSAAGQRGVTIASPGPAQVD